MLFSGFKMRETTGNILEAPKGYKLVRFSSFKTLVVLFFIIINNPEIILYQLYNFLCNKRFV